MWVIYWCIYWWLGVIRSGVGEKFEHTLSIILCNIWRFDRDTKVYIYVCVTTVIYMIMLVIKDTKHKNN